MLFRKRFFILVFTCLIYNYSYSQRITIKNIESKLITHEGAEFIGELKDLSSDIYLFNNYSNEGILYYDSKKYIISNLNFNVTSNSFESRIKRDKLFSFRGTLIDSIKINNQLFKNINNTFYEVLFEKELNFFLKKPNVEYREGSVNRLDGKVGKTRTYLVYNYLIKLDDVFEKVELNKKSIINLVKNSTEQDLLIDFVKSKDLSYKKENDFIEIFKYILKNKNIIQ